MSLENRLSILSNTINELVGAAGKAENTRIYPNAEVIDDAPADLPADYIIIVDEDGFYTPAVKVAGLNVSVGDFVNILYIKGTEPIAFQHGSESTGGGGGWPFLHVLTVDPTNTNADYPTIQDAIDAAVDGDGILVGAGTYTEQLTVDNSVTIIGLGEVNITFGTSPTLKIDAAGKTVYLDNLKVFNTDDSGDSVALYTTNGSAGRCIHCDFTGQGAGSATNCYGVEIADAGDEFAFTDCKLMAYDGVTLTYGLVNSGTVYLYNGYAIGAGDSIKNTGDLIINGTLIDNDTIDNTGNMYGNFNTGSGDFVIVPGNELKTDTINETTAAAGVTIDGVLLKDNYGNGSAWAFLAKNTSSAVAAVGDVGYIDSVGEYKTTTTAYSNVSWCVVTIGGANNADIYVAKRGRVTVNLNGNCSAGDYLFTSTTAGQAQPLATMRPEVFAIALTANAGGAGGTCSALLLTGTTDIPASSTNEIIRVVTSDGSDFTALINSAGSGGLTATNVPYDNISTGADTSIKPGNAGGADLARQRLYNSTRGTYRLITAVDTVNDKITTVSTADAWADNDTITIRSQTCTVAGPYFVDLDFSQTTEIPTLARFIYMHAQKLDSGSQQSVGVHPFEAYSGSKNAYTYNPAAGTYNTNFLIVPLIENRICWRFTASGVGTQSSWLFLRGFGVASP